VARGATGAPRNTPGSGVPANGGDTGVAQAQQTRGRAYGPAEPGSQGGRPGRPTGVNRLIAIVCGRRSKWAIVLFWVLVVVALGSLASKLNGAEKNDASSYLPGSAESTQELNEQAAFQSKNYNPALVLYVRSSGVTSADIAKAQADARYFASLPAVAGRVSPPIISNDHKAIETLVGSDLGYTSDIGGFITTVQNTATKNAGGLNVYIGGPAASANDELKIFKGIDSTLLYAALSVVIVLLLLTYRSPVLWLLPIISAGVALTVAEAVIYLLTQHANLTVNGQSGGILVVLVIGASTDYALLLVARYREELRRHEDRHQAMAVALRRAGPAIIASGLTVVIGMLCLMAAESNDISGLGPVAAIGVGVGLIAMITLLPALLVVFGRWIFWPVRPRYGSPEPTRRGVWARVGNAISRRPRAVWLVTAILLAAGSAGLIGFKFGPLTFAQSFRGTPASITAQNVQNAHFPAGTGTPVDVIANAASAGQVRSALAATPGIASVTPPVTKNGLSFLQATMNVSPDSNAAYTLVDHIRTAVHAIPGADAKVGGGTAINKDVQAAAAHDRNLLIPLILGVVLLILGLLLRAIVAPLVLIATVVLSFGAALGISSLFFSHVFGFAGADTSVPLFVFVFLVALGIDYNIFLMTRVREESHRVGTRRGALIGLAATGGVITAAGLVLAGTFAVLGTLPLVQFTEIGFAVALGVLLDTIIVRSVLVTALTLDIGRHMWWPSALSHPEVLARGDTLPPGDTPDPGGPEPPEGRSVTDGTAAPAHPQAGSVIDGT
jgi:RND superfamily putative drug exporter